VQADPQRRASFVVHSAIASFYHKSFPALGSASQGVRVKNIDAMDISNVVFKTTNIGSLGVELSEEQKKITKSIFSSFLKNDDEVCFVYRGVSKKYLFDRFVKEGDAFKEYSVMDKLFFFGDKSKSYLKKLGQEKQKKYLTNIEDSSYNAGIYIFDKFKKLSSAKNPYTQRYLNKITYFQYFLDENNRDKFSKAIKVSGQKVRDYYLSLLHTVGNFCIPNNSFHISSTLKFDIAKNFAGADDDRYVLLYMHRVSDSLPREKEIKILLKKYDLPFLDEVSIYPDQCEITIRAGMYPHDLFAVYNLVSEVLWVNPHIFTEYNKDLDLTKNSLIIPQSNFASKLVEETNFSGYNFTYDHEEYFEGEITTSN